MSDGNNRVLFANFDSTEQRRLWDKIIDEDNDVLARNSAAQHVWFEDDTHHIGEKILNMVPRLASEFAGILRTAYLWSPQIVLTDAQLFDGIFFLAFGPKAVIDMLGQSYKDGPAIVVSGRQDSLEECLVDFTTRTVKALREKSENKDLAAACKAADDQSTVRPLIYSALNVTVTEKMSFQYAEKCQDFSMRLKQCDAINDGRESKADVIAQMFADILSEGNDCPADAACRYRFLARRWQEWIDAERRGLIRYENQKKMASCVDFNTRFKQYAIENAVFLCRRYGFKCPCEKDAAALVPHDSEDRLLFWKTLWEITKKPERSKAFECIEQSGLPKMALYSVDNREHEYSQRMLHDWYQFVYQQTLAHHIGAQLIAVNVGSNTYANLVGKRSRGAALRLEGKATELLGEMTFTQFSVFLYQCRSVIDSWRRCGVNTEKNLNRRRTQAVAYAIGQAAEEHGLSDDLKSVGFGFILAAALAVLSAWLDATIFAGKMPVEIVVLVTASITIVPNIIEVGQWLLSVRSSSKTVVYLQ